jgi:hypothetical protein
VAVAMCEVILAVENEDEFVVVDFLEIYKLEDYSVHDFAEDTNSFSKCDFVLLLQEKRQVLRAVLVLFDQSLVAVAANSLIII